MKDIRYADYDIRDEQITKQLLYSNATFDIKEILSDETDLAYCSVSIITPSQCIRVAFDHCLSPGGHAGITDIILSRIYKDYIRTQTLGEQDVYFKNRENNIFILTTDNNVLIIMPEEGKINQQQYDELKKNIAEIKESDYIKTGRIKEIAFDDDFVAIDKIDEKINSLKNNITYKKVPKQYNISKFDFSSCKTEEDFDRYAEIYEKKLDDEIAQYKALGNGLKSREKEDKKTKKFSTSSIEKKVFKETTSEQRNNIADMENKAIKSKEEPNKVVE